MTLDAPTKQADFTEAGEPFALFAAWLAEAEGTEPNDPTAMALATVDASGMPNVRMVLLGFRGRGDLVHKPHRLREVLELEGALDRPVALRPLGCLGKGGLDLGLR